MGGGGRVLAFIVFDFMNLVHDRNLNYFYRCQTLMTQLIIKNSLGIFSGDF